MQLQFNIELNNDDELIHRVHNVAAGRVVINRFVLWIPKLTPKDSIYDRFVSSFLKDPVDIHETNVRGFSSYYSKWIFPNICYANRQCLRHCVILYARAGFPSCVCDYRIHLVVLAISSILKLLEFLRCDAPVASTLAWWQRLLIDVSESLRTVSLLQATTSLPILW